MESYAAERGVNGVSVVTLHAIPSARVRGSAPRVVAPVSPAAPVRAPAAHALHAANAAQAFQGGDGSQAVEAFAALQASPRPWISTCAPNHITRTQLTCMKVLTGSVL